MCVDTCTCALLFGFGSPPPPPISWALPEQQQQSLLVVPCLHGPEHRTVRAVLQLASRAPDAFAPTDLHVASALSAALAAAVTVTSVQVRIRSSRAALVAARDAQDALRSRLATQSLVLARGASLMAASTLHDVQATLRRLLRRALRVEHVSLLLVDHGRGTVWTPAPGDGLAARAALGDGLVGDAVFTGRVVVAANTDAASRFRSKLDAVDLPLPLAVSMMCVPISHVYALRDAAAGAAESPTRPAGGLRIRDPQSVDAVVRLTNPTTRPLKPSDSALPEALHDAIAAAVKAAGRLRDAAVYGQSEAAELQGRLARSTANATVLQTKVKEAKNKAALHERRAADLRVEYVWCVCVCRALV